VLFSNREIAALINQWFEPVWESVRDVPTVSVDFGHGVTVTRTLHGNIATWVCDNRGEVLDVLPGIYEPATYVSRLDQLRLLANYVEQPGSRIERLHVYHQRQATALLQKQPAPRFVNTAGMAKAMIERNTLAVLVPGAPDSVEPKSALNLPAAAGPGGRELGLDHDLWSRLIEDTRINERQRRLQIHEKLVSAQGLRPPELTRWLYREVLHSDLDDPYLGLGDLLLGKYPFAHEER
jgi:hypothetical protein